MAATNPQDLLNQASCQSCGLMTPADALRVALWDNVSQNIGGLTPVSPIPTSGLKGWWKSDTLGAVGTDVTQWDDSSGNGNHLTPLLAMMAPVVENSVFSTKSVFFQKIVSDALATASNIFGAGSDCSVFAVYAVDVDDVYGVAGQGAPLLENSTTFVLQSRNDLSDPYLSTFLGDILSSGAQNSGLIRLTGFTMSAATINLYDKDSVVGTGANPGVSTGTSIFRVGATFTNQENMLGEVAEVIAYNRVLNSSEITQVSNYLVAKYGVP